MSVSEQVTDANLLSLKGFGVLVHLITLLSTLRTGTEDLYLCLPDETSNRIHQCLGVQKKYRPVSVVRVSEDL